MWSSAGASPLQQIDPVLEDASADLGARWGQTFRRVLLPLLRPAFIAALMLLYRITGTAESLFKL